MVVKVEDEVPEIVCEDPRPLLFHARDNAFERVEDTPEVRLKGWRRIVQVGSHGIQAVRCFRFRRLRQISQAIDEDRWVHDRLTFSDVFVRCAPSKLFSEQDQ